MSADKTGNEAKSSILYLLEKRTIAAVTILNPKKWNVKIWNVFMELSETMVRISPPNGGKLF